MRFSQCEHFGKRDIGMQQTLQVRLLVSKMRSKFKYRVEDMNSLGQGVVSNTMDPWLSGFQFHLVRQIARTVGNLSRRQFPPLAAPFLSPSMRSLGEFPFLGDPS